VYTVIINSIFMETSMGFDEFDNKHFVHISEASNAFGTSLDTIRRWEKKGLIKAHRSSRGQRYFSKVEIERLQGKLQGHEQHPFKVLKAKRTSPYRVIELFAGAGGLALGMENAGLQTEMLVEIDKHAAQTLQVNRPHWKVICSDIAKVDFTQSSADIVTGGFPCQAFSYAGKRLGFEDTRGTLFYEYARTLREVHPKVIVGENVRGLEKHDNGRTLSTMLAILDELGYRVEYRILRTQYLDVPQKRERLVMIGVRRDLNLPICFPKEQDYTIGLREALADVPPSLGQTYTPTKQKIMAKIPAGGYWRDLPESLQKSYMGKSFYLGGGKTGMARRLSWDEPSLTLTCNPAQKQTERCHPGETRPLNVREYARIQSFPDDWTFEGSVSSQYKQIGNAVPVNLGYHIGRCLVAMLNGKPDPKTMEVLDQTLF
jgi:DNA (cytosine-5)-methyltransferase 1